MTSAVEAARDADSTELRYLLRSGAVLGVMQSVIVALFGIASRMLSGVVEVIVLTIVLLIGLAITIALPGLWTRARTIEGIAGAAGIGLFATAIFLVIDVVAFQPLGLYTNRWLELGGGMYWWYHPVWWMVGTFVPWMGAWALANQANRSGSANAGALLIGTFVLAAIIMAITAVTHFPGAAFGIGTFAVAILPATVLMVLVTALGARRP